MWCIIAAKGLTQRPGQMLKLSKANYPVTLHPTEPQFSLMTHSTREPVHVLAASGHTSHTKHTRTLC